jgi:hypothetical protein
MPVKLNLESALSAAKEARTRDMSEIKPERRDKPVSLRMDETAHRRFRAPAPSLRNRASTFPRAVLYNLRVGNDRGGGLHNKQGRCAGRKGKKRLLAVSGRLHSGKAKIAFCEIRRAASGRV